MRKSLPVSLLVGLAAVMSACADGPLDPSATPDAPVFASSRSAQPIGINVGLTGPLTPDVEARLSEYGRIMDQIPQLDVVLLVGSAADVPEIAALPFVAFAEPDVEVSTGPLDAEIAPELSGGFGMWNLDAINVTSQPGPGTRAVPQTGEGVYVGVLDTGLLHTWRLYFPEERIASGYAKAFSGGWHPNASNPETPNAWEQDVSGHGTHVTARSSALISSARRSMASRRRLR